jgi:hypothetical protein
MLFNLYLLSVPVCAFLFPWAHWYKGNDVNLGDLSAMFFVAAIPGVNVVVAIFILADMCKNVGWFDKVFLKGRRAR